jgi:hypothetical protein
MDHDAGVSADAGAIDPYERYAAGLPLQVQEHLAYDPALGADCVARLGAAKASCALSEPASEAIDRACFVYRGTLPVGAPCVDGVECAPPDGARAACLRGSPMTTTATGACAVVARGAPGDLCDPFAEAGALHFCDPAEGLFCGASGACEKRRAEGAACVRSADQNACVDGLYCGDASTCVPRKATGDPCLSHSECLSGTCYRDQCADTQPIPSKESCIAADAGPKPSVADAAADGDAADAADDGDAADAEGG